MSETPKQYTLDDVTQMTYEEFSKTDQNLLPVELDPTNLETKKDFEDMQKWIGFYSACSETETKPKESFARNLITQPALLIFGQDFLLGQH